MRWTVTTNTGETFTGRADRIVAKMNDTAFNREDSPRGYMTAVAHRLGMTDDTTIDTSSAPAFLRSLEAAGVVTITQEVEAA